MAPTFVMFALMLFALSYAYEPKMEGEQQQGLLSLLVNDVEVDDVVHEVRLNKNSKYKVTCVNNAGLISHAYPYFEEDETWQPEYGLILYMDGEIVDYSSASASQVSYTFIPSNIKKERTLLNCTTTFEKKSRTLELVLEHDYLNTPKPEKSLMSPALLVMCGAILMVVILLILTVVLACHFSEPSKRSNSKYARLDEASQKI